MYKSEIRTEVKKKTIGLFLAGAAAIVMLSACGGSTPASGSANGPDNTAQPNTPAQENTSVANTDNKQEPVSEEPSGSVADASGEQYVFEYQDVTIKVDTDVAPVIEALGEAKGYFEAASCAFEGLDKVYTYNDFEISTYPADDKDLISLIVFRSDIISTPEGVSIGTKASKVKDIYGEGTEQAGMLVYEKGGMKLCFIIKEDKVASVEYHSSTLN